MKENNIKNLLKDSKAYYENNDYYEIFSKAEDGEGKVAAYLKEQAKEKIVLDAGCGTGKFLEQLENESSKYIGVDLSFEQLIKAQSKKKKSNTIFINSNLKDIMLESNSVDLIVSPWVLGTVTDLVERTKCLNELKRVLKPGGEIILIENEENSEFEYLRNHHKDKKTNIYNNWIRNNDFNKVEEINTYFNFANLKEAKLCFRKIYGNEVANKIKNNKIEHKIGIFKYAK
ncbi:MAG: class I SAM-dependent methyltransferase [Bacilli bacterium]|nr:class I SAM-dependent methyltransferase [Bacilli bacterium]